MLKKQDVLPRLNIPDLCREVVPSLKSIAGNGQALGLCPFHDDKTPSLSVNLNTGAFHCKACNQKGSDPIDLCKQAWGVDFKAALLRLAQRVGLAVEQTVTGTFIYHDAEGAEIYRKDRLEPSRDGRPKEFVFYHVDRTGKRKSGRGSTSPTLYKLPAVARASEVFIVEGEAQADLLNGWSLTATTLDAGSSSKLTPAMAAHLQGKRLVILPDNDPPGQNYARTLAGKLHSKCHGLKIVRLPNLPCKGDVLDWAEKPGNDKARLLDLVAATEEWEPPEWEEDAPQPAPEPSPQHVDAPAQTIPTQEQAARAFPRLYLDTEKLLNDPRRFHFRPGESVIYDALIFRLARAPGARLPNVPAALARLMDTDATAVEGAIDMALRHGLLLADSDGNLSNQIVTEAYAHAVETCRKNAENGSKGGKTPRRKPSKHGQNR